RMTRPRHTPLFASLGLVLAGAALGGEAPAEPATRDAPKKEAEQAAEPVHLWANKVRYLHQQQRAVAEGRVTVIKGDLRIDCDEMVALLEPETNRFRKLTAKGNVRVHTVPPLTTRPARRPKLQAVEGGRSATCAFAQYDPVAETVVLEGSEDEPPVVQLDRTRVRGTRITYDRKKDLVTIENGKITTYIASTTVAPSPKAATANAPR
ncbi:MAG: LptA/OstA family protein, partial [Planctomycetota bacterium]